MCKVISKGDELHEDLAQEVTLYLLTLDKDKIKESYERGTLCNYAFTVSYMKWNSNNGREVGEVNNSCFKAVYRDYKYFTDDLEDYRNNLYEEEDNPFNIDTLLVQLSTLDRLTLEELMTVNFNISLLSERTNITRHNLKIRIDAIYDKLRDNRD
jgi:hypothetical protein